MRGSGWSCSARLEPKAGAIQSMTRAHELAGLNHRLDVIGGVLESESRDLLQAFFQGPPRLSVRSGDRE